LLLWRLENVILIGETQVTHNHYGGFMVKRLTLTVSVGIIALMLAAGAVWSTPAQKQTLFREIAGPVGSPNQQGSSIPLPPGVILTSPGQQVGTTHYDYQTNGSTGNRVVKDVSGNIHVCWMNGISFWSGNRWVYYNFRDAAAGTWNWTTTGVQVNPPPQGDGYTNMDLLSGGEGVIEYHSLTDQDWVVLSVDVLPGFGTFTEYDVPDRIPGDTVAIWPYVAVDRQDRIHVVAHAYYSEGGSTKRVIYTRSEDQGVNWTTPVDFDSTNSISTIIVASSVNDKVAIINPQYGQHPDAFNDIIYIESQDGVTWDWQNKHNVTMYDTSCYRDSIWAYADNDAVYDNNGDLHIVWNAFKTVPGGEALLQSFLYHWSEATGISFIAEHPDEPSWPPNCATGGWNWPLAKLSLGVDDENNLFCIFTRFDSTDCSVGGYANGELYGTASNDGGVTWGRMVNLTNSPTPDCWPGECDSDHWSSMAELVDDSLYILYINDKDAGGIPQTEGVDTENPVMYYAVHKDTLLQMLKVEEEKEVEPTSFVLKQNYPNPFNASTTIQYVTLASGKVELSVYNLAGEKVAVLTDEVVPVGEHTVTWDAAAVASGIYYCKLTTSEGTAAKRMLLLK
jgi:hypothetical protein